MKSMIKSKKEIIQSYKEMKFKMGVFQIRNITSNKVFVEGSTDLSAIWNRHRFQLNNGSHPNVNLQKDWNDSGEQNFLYEIISELTEDETMTDPRKEVKKLEIMFLDELQPYNDKGYNIKKGG